MYYLRAIDNSFFHWVLKIESGQFLDASGVHSDVDALLSQYDPSFTIHKENGTNQPSFDINDEYYCPAWVWNEACTTAEEIVRHLYSHRSYSLF